MEMTTIDKLIVCGGVSIKVTSSQVECDADCKFSLKGNELTVTALNTFSGNIIFGNDGFIVSTGNFINTGVIINNGVYMNNRVHEMPAQNNDEKGERIFPAVINLSSVQISGSARMDINPGVLKPSHSIQISGSGCCELSRERFRSATLSISGSGMLNCGKSTFRKININVTGSGGIRNFHTTRNCIARLTGSGYITGTLEAKASVQNTCVGSGNISLSERR